MSFLTGVPFSFSYTADNVSRSIFGKYEIIIFRNKEQDSSSENRNNVFMPEAKHPD